jgi:hypothetical protein
MEKLQQRILRAIKLDGSLYEEVEADSGALTQSIVVILLSSLAAGISNIFTIGISSIISATLSTFILWLIWAYITYLIGVKFLPEATTQSTYTELLRTTGFASAPGILRVLGIIPGIGSIINLIAWIWMLIAMVVAVKHALDYSTMVRSAAVCVLGWIVFVVISWLLHWIF